MKNYVISLQSAVDRREHITKEFGKQNIAFTFFDAITPDMILQLEETFGFNLSEAAKLSKGEKACFASHVCLWQKMIDENLEFLAIFEDDVFLGQDANELLCDKQLISDSYNNEPFDLIKLETFLIKVHLGKQKPSPLKNRELCRLKSMHTGTGGYIMSIQGAKKLMQIAQNLSIDEIMPIDHLMFDGYLKSIITYQISPAICLQSMLLDKVQFPSRLNNSRIEEKNFTDYNKKQKKLIQKIKDMFKRNYRSIGKRTFFKIVEFK